MAYSAKLWAKIRAEYESGNHASVEALHQKLSKKHQKFPSVVSINQQSQRENWSKAALKPLIEKTIQQKFIEAFAKKGFDESRVAEIIDEMGRATKPCIITGYGKPKSSEEAGGEPQGFATEIEDWQARDKAVTQYAKLTGSYAAEKQDLTHSFPDKIEIEIIKAVGVK